jgi:zinc/manganese transport system permease protein
VVEPDIWWLLPLTISLLIGAICPATGALLITQRRVLLANLMAHSVLPGLVIALAIGIDPSIGGLISGLLGALVAERLNRRFKGREEGAMNTVLAGFTALGVLLVPLLEARVDLETILFGDLLAATTTDLLRQPSQPVPCWRCWCGATETWCSLASTPREQPSPNDRFS